VGEELVEKNKQKTNIKQEESVGKKKKKKKRRTRRKACVQKKGRRAYKERKACVRKHENCAYESKNTVRTKETKLYVRTKEKLCAQNERTLCVYVPVVPAKKLSPRAAVQVVAGFPVEENSALTWTFSKFMKE
jgi:hypothetical protein